MKGIRGGTLLGKGLFHSEYYAFEMLLIESPRLDYSFHVPGGFPVDFVSVLFVLFVETIDSLIVKHFIQRLYLVFCTGISQ